MFLSPFLRHVEEEVGDDGEHDRVDRESVCRGASRLGDLEPVGCLGHDGHGNAANEAVNQTVRHGGADDKKE